MDAQTIILGIVFTALGGILGAGASWYFSRLYYLRSGADLEAALKPYGTDAKQALRAMTALGRMLEQAGIGKPTYDASGHLNGVQIEVTGTGGIKMGGTADAYVVRGTPATYDRQHEQPESKPLTPEQPDPA